MNYELLNAARVFVGQLRGASDSDINAAFQRLANEANDSDFAADLEPKQGVCLAMTAEIRRRAFRAGQLHTCKICGPECSC